MANVDSLVWYENGEVAGVREFQTAKALMQGRDLSQLVPSQWGPVHLFDLCISFGYQDTANAMAEAGVTGCMLEARHLGPFAWASRADDWLLCFGGSCTCAGWQTCERCSFGFPLSEGAWMRDWNAELTEATCAARTAAARPLAARVLELLVSGTRPRFAVSRLCSGVYFFAVFCDWHFLGSL